MQPITPPRPNAFVAPVKLDEMRMGRDASRIADEVISHLAALPGAASAVASFDAD